MYKIYVCCLMILTLFVVLLYGVTALLDMHNDFAVAGAVTLLVAAVPMMVALINMLISAVKALRGGTDATK